MLREVASPSTYAKRPWHVVKILWTVLIRILVPIDLSRIPEFLDKFVAHLQRSRAKVRPRQIDRMRDSLSGAAQHSPDWA